MDAAAQGEAGGGQELVDASVAARIAARLAGRDPLAGSYLFAGIDEQMAQLATEGVRLVEEETGFGVVSPALPRVATRAEWAAANVRPLLTLMDPLLQKVRSQLGPAGGRLAGRAYGPFLGAQLGAVLGLISHRILGQYDPLGDPPEAVWFVGTNMILTERRLGFSPRDFRLWVCVHELTHRAQFQGKPHLGRHFLDSVAELLGSMDLDARSWGSRLLEAARRPPSGAPLGALVLSPEQKKAFDSIQALMSVIEGHANFVMDRIALREIPSQPRMRRALRRAAPGGPLAKILQRLLGLEIKRLQYEEGQRFFDTVFEKAGPEGVGACFSSVEALPELGEIRAPDTWLARIGV